MTTMPMEHAACDGRGCLNCQGGWEDRPITLWEVDLYRSLSSGTKEARRECDVRLDHGSCWRCDRTVAKYEAMAERAVVKWIAQGSQCPHPCTNCLYAGENGDSCVTAALKEEQAKRSRHGA